MKTVLVALAVALSLAVTSTAVLAAPPAPEEKDGKAGNPNRPQVAAVEKAKRQSVAGVVQSKGDSSFVVLAKRGSVTVKVTDATRYSVKGKRDATLADVPVGGRVNVQGTRNGDDLEARRVHVIPGRLSFWHAAGEVTAYTEASDTSNGSITVKNRFNVLYTFVLTRDTRIVVPEGQAKPAVGDWVTVVGARAETPTLTPTARSVVVHKKKQ